MAEESGGEKTLPASQRKKQRAREEGNVAKSQDLSAAVMLLVALAVLYYAGPWAFEDMMGTMRHYLSGAHAIAVQAGDRSLALDVLIRMGRPVLPLMLVLMIMGMAVNAVQVGFLISPKALMPKFERVNPLSGFSRFFSLRSFVELLKSVFKLALVGTLVYFAVRDRWEELISMMGMAPPGIIHTLAGLTFAVWWRIVAAMLALGILDYGFQRWQYERDLKMSQREAREEAKEMEGDPRIKQRIRQIQRRVAAQRMMKQVPTADVVITNPTHYAVALRYDAATMQAPVVVAKGMRLVAQRIRQTAVEHDVPIVERPELARALHKGIEIGHPVPEDLFRAVAEVLAFVYRIDRREEKIRERARSVKPMKRAI